MTRTGKTQLAQRLREKFGTKALPPIVPNTLNLERDNPSATRAKITHKTRLDLTVQCTCEGYRSHMQCKHTNSLLQELEEGLTKIRLERQRREVEKTFRGKK